MVLGNLGVSGIGPQSDGMRRARADRAHDSAGCRHPANSSRGRGGRAGPGRGRWSAAAKATTEAAKKAAAYTPASPTAKGETKTTKSGVKYETLKEGTGDELKPGSVALFHYEGKLEDGTVFDSSRQEGRAAQGRAVGTGQLIKGWEEGMPGMKVGEIRKLFVPSAWATRTGATAQDPPQLQPALRGRAAQDRQLSAIPLRPSVRPGRQPCSQARGPARIARPVPNSQTRRRVTATRGSPRISSE